MVVRSVGASLGEWYQQCCSQHAVALALSTGGNRVTDQQPHPDVEQGGGVHQSTLRHHEGGAKLSWADPQSQVRGADMQHGTELLCGQRLGVLISFPQMSESTGLADWNRGRWTKKRMRKKKKMRMKSQNTGSHTPA